MPSRRWSKSARQTPGERLPASSGTRSRTHRPKAGRRNIVVFSDFARGDWESFQIRNLKQWNPHAHLQFVRVAPEAGVEEPELPGREDEALAAQSGFFPSPSARASSIGERRRNQKYPCGCTWGEELQETIEVDLEPNGASPVSFRV